MQNTAITVLISSSLWNHHLAVTYMGVRDKIRHQIWLSHKNLSGGLIFKKFKTILGILYDVRRC